MPNSPQSSAARYAVAALAVVVAVALRRVLDPVFGDAVPFTTLLFAVLVAAWYGGLGPALFATLLGAALAARFLLHPRDSFAIEGAENRAGFLLYLLTGAGIAALGGVMRRSRERAAAAAAAAGTQRDELRITLESIGDAVIAADAAGRVEALNPVAERLTGWPKAEAAGRPLGDVFRIVNEQTRAPTADPVARVLATGVVVGLANHTLLIARDGTEVPIDDSAAPIRDADGRLRGVVLVFRDVTEERQALAALRASEARKAAILEAALDAIVTIDHRGTVIEFNPAAERMFGYARADALGRELADLIVPAGLREGHRQGLARYLATGEGPVLGRRIEMPAVRADGAEIPVELAITLPAGNGPPVFTAYLRDISERKKAEHRRAARLVVTQTLAQAETINEALPTILRAVGETLGWDVGAYWAPDPDGPGLRCVEVWSVPAADPQGFAADTRGRALPEGAGLPGRVRAAGRPVWVADFTADPAFPRREEAAAHGLRGAFGFPVLRDSTVLGVIEFFSHEVREPDPDLLEMVSTLGGQIGQFVERRQAEERLRDEVRVTETLNRLGPKVAAELDLQKVVQLVTDEATRLTEAQFGAFFYNVLDERGEAYTLYSVSGAPREAFEQFPMPRNTPLFGPTFRGEGVVRLADVTKDPRYGQNAPHAGMPEGHLPVRSYLAVPVKSRSGEVLGGLFFGHAEVGVLTDRHERLVVGMAAQAAIAIDNARLYGRVQESEERFRQLAEHITDVFWLVDARTRQLLYVSPAYEEVWGRPRQSLYDSPESFLDGVHPDDRERVRAFSDRLAGGEPGSEEYRVVRPDWSVRWVADRGYPIRDADGTVTRVAGIVEDVTARRAAEAERRDSEEWLRLSLAAGRMGVWGWDLRTGGIRWSDNLEAIHGLPPGAFDGTFEGFLELVHPADRDLVQEAVSTAVAEQSSYDVEFRNVWPDGSVRWLAGKGQVFLDGGRPARMVGVAMDVTARKRAEISTRFLADASAVLAALTDEASALQKVATLAVPHFADWCAVDLADPDGSLRRVAVAHVDPEKVKLAHQIHERWPPDPNAPRGVPEILRTGRPQLVPEITDETLTSSTTDPELLRVMRELGLRSYVGVPLTVRGKAIGALTFIAAESGRRYDEADLAAAEDLARRAAVAIENAQLYQAVREADRRKDEFLATLAHELRNPLAPIRNALYLLRTTGATGPTVPRALDMMGRQTDILARLVDELLDVSRVMRGKVDLRPEPVDLAAVAARAVETAQPLIDSRKHELTVAVPDHPVRVTADPVRMTEVVSNLLTNAAKYTDPGGRIRLAVEAAGGQAVIRVTDTGVGIAPDVLPKVFDLFFQADTTAAGTQGGLGIGLTLVRRLVELHGGTVEAKSGGLGTGSEFVVRLPLLGREEGGGRREDGRQDGSSLTPQPSDRKRVLVVDDNNDAADSLAMLLRLEGHDVRVARNGPSAVEAAQADPPDVVLLDLGMPGMDGFEVARRLRQGPAARTFIAALTGWGQEEDRRRTREAGFDHHLVKPADPNDLRELLARVGRN